MKLRDVLKRSALATLLATSLTGAYAASEAEPNSALEQAERLVFTVSGSTGVATMDGTVSGGDPDFFKFWAMKGSVVTFDIDDGYTATGDPGSVDTFLSVLNEAGLTVDIQGTASIIDEGSVSAADPNLTHIIADDGFHYVAVTADPEWVWDGYFISGGNPGSGSYKLIVTIVAPANSAWVPGSAPGETGPTAGTDSGTPPTSDSGTPPDNGGTTAGTMLSVPIEVKPGKRRVKHLETRSKGVLPVAIISTDELKAEDIDVSTLTFGKHGDEASLRDCHPVLTKVNRDRLPDLVCFFRIDQTGLERGDERAELRGMTKNATPFQGSGMLKVPHEKKHKHRHRHAKDREKHASRDR